MSTKVEAVKETEVKEVVLDTQKEKIRNLVKGVYDIQKLRIATGNRIVQSFNIQMGQLPSSKQEDMDAEVQSLIKQLREEYRRITDAYLTGSFAYSYKDGKEKVEKVIEVKKYKRVDKIIEELNKNEDAGVKLIRSKVDYELMSTYVDLINTEQKMNKVLEKEVEKHPMWEKFFKGVTGCGPLMAAVCISYFDIHKARHVSSFWKYAGLDTVAVDVPAVVGHTEDGKPIYSETETVTIREGRGRKHTEIFEYVDKDGNTKTKRGLTYNPELKTKLCGVLGSCFLKNPGCKYEQIYRDYRFRLENRADSEELTKARKHNMANRYMIKQFVRDLWVTWRAYEGYVVTEPYEVAYLNRKPHKYNEYHERVAMSTAK